VTVTAKQYISFIAGDWADPIADLAVAWRRRLESDRDSNHITPYDRGMAASIILQLVVMLESCTLRAFWNVECPAAGTPKWSVFDWWNSSDYAETEAVLDAIVLRDVIAHNHLYWFDGADQSSTEFEHAYGGDGKFRARAAHGRLHHTGMTCIPRALGPAEVRKASEIVEAALRWLTAGHSNIDADFYFARRGQHKTLWQVLGATLDVACSRNPNADGP
jgi:hypothetical protein